MDGRRGNVKPRRLPERARTHAVDPDALFLILRRALRSAAWNEAVGPAEQLLQWLAEQGSPPRITGTRIVDRIIAESTCRAVAAWETPLASMPERDERAAPSSPKTPLGHPRRRGMSHRPPIG